MSAALRAKILGRCSPKRPCAPADPLVSDDDRDLSPLQRAYLARLFDRLHQRSDEFAVSGPESLQVGVLSILRSAFQGAVFDRVPKVLGSSLHTAGGGLGGRDGGGLGLDGGTRVLLDQAFWKRVLQAYKSFCADHGVRARMPLFLSVPKGDQPAAKRARTA